jgi:putative ABC transport system ATP-binding protein
MAALLELRDVWKIYQLGDVEVQALRGISIDVQAHEFVAVMGASGSGKSTFMNIAGCLDQPTRGTYRLDGILVSDMTPDERAEIRNTRIGFVFQHFNLLARTTARENVELPLVYAGVPFAEQRVRADAALVAVGLRGREDHVPSQLSGGQQQRVAIARALVNNPSLVLADEPTGNLDTETSTEIMDVFTGLHREQGVTIVLVTHEPDIAEYAERRITFRDGHVMSDVRAGRATRAGRGHER